MAEVYVGEIVNTHGIKGELRIISDFKYKNLIFEPGFNLYVGKRREKLTIITYRKHKNYDMVTFEGINDINDAIAYKGDSVYINRDDIKIDGFVNEDIVGLSVYSDNKFIGTVESVVDNTAHEILIVTNEEKRHMIPFIDEFIVGVDLENKRIDVNLIEGLLDENWYSNTIS